MTRQPTVVAETKASEYVTPDAPGCKARSLSIAEMQLAVRELQARRYPEPGESGGDVRTEPRNPRGDDESGARRSRGDSGPPTTRWIAVRAAHAGAGASTVALAISDAAAATGRPAHLIEGARASRSGLVAAASAELGVDDTGMWRRGLRAAVTIDRRASGGPCSGWPEPLVEDDPVMVVDLGLGDEIPACSFGDPTVTVVVCRPTVPGVRLIEHLLDRLGERPVVIAAVGPSRWPGVVSASLGSRLVALRDAGRLVAVPLDRRLVVGGLTSSPLPKPVHAAGRALLELLGDFRPVVVDALRATRPHFPTREGARP